MLCSFFGLGESRGSGGSPPASGPPCTQHRRASYSDHDTQECCIAGTDRNDSGNRSLSVDVRLYRPQCPAGIGSSGDAVSVVRLCVCLFQHGCVLLRVLQSAIMILPKDGAVFDKCLVHGFDRIAAFMRGDSFSHGWSALGDPYGKVILRGFGCPEGLCAARAWQTVKAALGANLRSIVQSSCHRAWMHLSNAI